MRRTEENGKENIGKCVDWSVKGGNWKEDTIIDTNTMIRRNRKENHKRLLKTFRWNVKPFVSLLLWDTIYLTFWLLFCSARNEFNQTQWLRTEKDPTILKENRILSCDKIPTIYKQPGKDFSFFIIRFKGLVTMRQKAYCFALLMSKKCDKKFSNK